MQLIGHARIASLWEWERLWSHINKKELQTCFIALKYFVSHLRDIHVQLSVDNTAAVSYLNHAGGDKVTSFVRSRNCNLGMVFTEKDLSFSNSHTRHCKQNPRWSVSSEARKHRMDVRFQCFSSDSGCLSAASSGCFSPQPSTPKLFFRDPRSTGYGNRCFQHSMEIQSVLPVSSFSSHSEMYSENKPGSDRCIAHNASLEILTMVPSFTRMLMDLPALLPLHAKLLHLPMFPSQVHPLIEKKINLAIWPVSGNPSKSEGFLKGCPKYCFLPGDPVQRNITNQHGNHFIAGVLKNRKIRFLAL